jgi:crossover junction endodeoxyribonuclease RuvC
MELHAVLNSGHRRGGSIMRYIGGHTRLFSTFTPMVLAAIGTLPLPIIARSIIIPMERDDGSEPLQRFDPNDTRTKIDMDTIYRVIFDWARTITLDPNPKMPSELRNREADNWRPLLAIADVCGCGDEAREAALEFNRTYQDEDAGVLLLSDIRDIFDRRRVDRLPAQSWSRTLPISTMVFERNGRADAVSENCPACYACSVFIPDRFGGLCRATRPAGVPRVILENSSRRHGGHTARKRHNRHNPVISYLSATFETARVTARMMKKSLGIDIGLSGACALLTEAGELVEVRDMPVLCDGAAKRRTINAPLLAQIIKGMAPNRAYVQRVAARPGEGAVGAFAFGRGRGVIEGVLGTLGVPAVFITPAAWKRRVGLPAGTDKDASSSEAIRRWPKDAGLFARKLDNGRSDACLIGIAGLKKGRDDSKFPGDLCRRGKGAAAGHVLRRACL